MKRKIWVNGAVCYEWNSPAVLLNGNLILRASTPTARCETSGPACDTQQLECHDCRWQHEGQPLRREDSGVLQRKCWYIQYICCWWISRIRKKSRFCRDIKHYSTSMFTKLIPYSAAFCTFIILLTLCLHLVSLFLCIFKYSVTSFWSVIKINVFSTSSKKHSAFL